MNGKLLPQGRSWTIVLERDDSLEEPRNFRQLHGLLSRFTQENGINYHWHSFILDDDKITVQFWTLDENIIVNCCAYLNKMGYKII